MAHDLLVEHVPDVDETTDDVLFDIDESSVDEFNVLACSNYY